MRQSSIYSTRITRLTGLLPRPSNAYVCSRLVFLQANAVSDKLLDLRECKLNGSDLSGKTLSGALLLDADLSNANLREAVFSKACSQNVQGWCAVPVNCHY